MEKINLFFEQIYSWFMELPQDLSDVLYEIPALDGSDEFLLSSAYPTIGITTLAISLIIAFAFYIWPGNHPRFKAWWAWLLTLAINAGINFGVALAYLKYRIGTINEDDTLLEAMKGYTPYNNETNSIDLSTSTFIDFGIINICVSVLCFIFCSLLLNWFSSTCRFSPFRK